MLLSQMLLACIHQIVFLIKLDITLQDKIVNKLLYVMLSALFVIGTNILNKYGISIKIFDVAIFSTAILLITYRLKRLALFKEELYLVIFVSFYFVVNYTIHGNGVGLTILLPPIIFLSILINGDKNIGLFLQRIVYISFILLSSTLILERVLGINFFPAYIDSEFVDMTDIAKGFRSTGFFGHPLQNALIVYVFISYILSSRSFSITHKYIYSFIGLLAISCCNTRAAMVLTAATIAIYTLHLLFARNVKLKMKVVIIIIGVIIVVGSIQLLLSGFVGSRIIEMGLFDDSSAKVRLDIFNMFDLFSLKSFFVGLDEMQKLGLMSYLGYVIIENFWLVWLINYGVVFLVPFIIFYYKMLRKYFMQIKLINNFMMLSFFILASTNNSLAAQHRPLTIFLLCYLLIFKESLDAPNNQRLP